MFAILKTGGKQYKVAKEEKLLIEKIDGNIGDEVVFNDIIMVNDNGKTEIGSPLVKDAAVVAEVIKQTRGPKITIIYKRRRKNRRSYYSGSHIYNTWGRISRFNRTRS